MSASEGWIYAMVNPTVPDMIKLGATVHDPLLRAKQLSASTSAALPFVLAYSRYVAAPFQVEAALHRTLAAHRVNESREFFKIELHKAIELMDRYDELTQAIDAEEYPFARLFETFPDDYEGRELIGDERAKCRVLETTL